MKKEEAMKKEEEFVKDAAEIVPVKQTVVKTLVVSGKSVAKTAVTATAISFAVTVGIKAGESLFKFISNGFTKLVNKRNEKKEAK